MAQQEIMHLVDDLDGEAADVTVTFGLDGRTYEIDLSDGHAAALRDRLSPYVAAARRVTSPAVRCPASAADPERPGSRAEARAMRVWASSNGFEVAGRGRLPVPIVRAYRAAHTSDSATPQPATAPSPPTGAAEDASSSLGGGDADVLAWHEAKNYKIPADRIVTGLMRHRHRKAHQAAD